MPHTSKETFIAVYKDAEFIVPLENTQAAEIPDIGGYLYSESQTTVGGVAYWHLSGYINVSKLRTEPTFVSSKNRFKGNDEYVYFKNGAKMRILEKKPTPLTSVLFELGAIKKENITIVNGVQTSVSMIDSARGYMVRYPYNGRHYIGFILVKNDVWSSSCYFYGVEDKFWEEAKNDPYTYGTKPKDNGGQGIGDINSTGVHTSPIPGIGIPTGGRGLHIYRISSSGYNSLQNYLWGEGDTIAKSLWQKFQNKTHNPSNSVVACFRLPSAFMPSAGASVGVQLAGVNLPTTGTYLVNESYYTHTEITLANPDGNPFEQPFYSWLDYSGVTCKIGVPFCGEIAVPAEKVYGNKVVIKYRCDWFNGNIGATVFAGDTMIADLTGNVAYSIPVSGGDDGTLDRIGALAAGALTIATAETGAAAVAGIATAGAGVAGAQYKTYINNCNISGSVSSCINGVAYIEFILPSTAYPYEDSTAYAQAYALPAVEFSGSLKGFEGGYGEFDVCRKEDGLYIPNASEAEKEEIIRLLREGVIV